MQSEHTRERLRVVSGAIETESGTPIAHMDREPGNGTTPVERDDTAHRLALAYNGHDDLVDALRGMLAAGPGCSCVDRGGMVGLDCEVCHANKVLKGT